MPHGKTIQIFFSTGTVGGIKYAQVLNWTGQAIQCPRVSTAELGDWEETEKPGIYFLFGEDKDTGEPTVYLGESENVRSRILQQETGKEWWNEVILFSSKDDNLTKAHVKYLECRCYVLAKAAERYQVNNANCPTESALPRSDRHAMEEFIDHVRLVVAALGHRVFEPVAPRATPLQPTPPNLEVSNSSLQNQEKRSNTVTGHSTINRDNSATIGGSETPAHGPARFSFAPKDASAKGVLTDEGFVILAGSTAAKDTAESCPPAAKRRRDDLISTGLLADDGARLVFKKDVSFGSPSAAACVVSGNSRNGLIEWKDGQGRELKRYYSDRINPYG